MHFLSGRLLSGAGLSFGLLVDHVDAVPAAIGHGIAEPEPMMMMATIHRKRAASLYAAPEPLGVPFTTLDRIFEPVQTRRWWM